MNSEWTDVTAQLLSLTDNLPFLTIIQHSDLDLQDTMVAHEINDPKIDPKWDIKQEFTISKMVAEGRIELPEALSIKDLKNIYSEVLKQQTFVMQGQPAQQTIYTFSYLYDDNLCKNCHFMAPLVESVNSLGSYIYELNKTSSTLKDDDLAMLSFSFKKSLKSHDQISQLFLKAQKQVQIKLKGEKEAQIQLEAKELIAHIKLRRCLHLLAKVLGKTYENKNQPKIQAEIKTLRKRIHQLEALVQKNQLKSTLPKGVFDQDIWKTLRSNLNFKTIKPITLPQVFEQLNNMLNQLELFLPPPLKITQYKHRLDILSYKKINILSKSYLKNNFFAKENYLFSTIKTEEALVNDLKEWMVITPEVRNHQKFNNLISLSAPTLADSFYKMLGRNSRWFWEISKIYEDINALIHFCTELDGFMQDKKKDAFVSSWFYNYATTSMTRQILWGFEEDLYQPSQYHYVAYYLQYILHINQKNNNFFINKLDKAIVQTYYQKSLTKKLKKQLSEVQKRYLADALYLKGLHYYFRSFYRLLILLIKRGHITDPFTDQLELRINNRFRIFKNILFLKKLNFESYTKEVELVLTDQNKIIEEATQLLKAAKNVFSLFNQFEEHETYYRQCEEAVILEKLCIKLSLVAMTLKFKQPKKYQIRKEYPKFPEIHIQ